MIRIVPVTLRDLAVLCNLAATARRLRIAIAKNWSNEGVLRACVIQYRHAKREVPVLNVSLLGRRALFALLGRGSREDDRVAEVGRYVNRHYRMS
jgi:hypothetical protein